MIMPMSYYPTAAGLRINFVEPETDIAMYNNDAFFETPSGSDNGGDLTVAGGGLRVLANDDGNGALYIYDPQTAADILVNVNGVVTTFVYDDSFAGYGLWVATSVPLYPIGTLVPVAFTLVL